MYWSGCVTVSYTHLNAVTRPLHGIGAEIVAARAPLFDRAGQVAAFAQALEGGAAAVICNHVSNVFGFILPVEEIAALCRERGIPFILDASQSAGCLPVRQDQLEAAFIAMPGHKGLYGLSLIHIYPCDGQGGSHALAYHWLDPEIRRYFWR